MPMYYFSGNRFTKSDRGWIAAGLRLVPDKYKQRVCDRYTKLYLTSDNKRKAANTYLHRVARFFDDKR